MAEWTASGAISFPPLAAEGTIALPIGLRGAVTLPRLQIGGQSGQTINLSGAVTLPSLTARAYLRWRASLYLLTGQVRASGCTILAFVGPQNRYVEWSILSGGGALFPDREYTDEYGRAGCRYEAGGYVGAVTIEARYGA